MYKVIITGASGMVGKGVLLECLDHDQISEVLSLGRAELDMKHPKLKQIVHKDFNNFESLKAELTTYDACYFCLGVSAFRMKGGEPISSQFERMKRSRNQFMLQLI